MNRVQLSYPAKGINITKVMQPPKNRTDYQQWLTAARKVIPEIPNTEHRVDWKIFNEIVTDKTICLELRDNFGNKCAVIMERAMNMKA